MKPTRLFALVLLVSVSQISLASEIIAPDLDTPYDQWTWLATHNSYSNPDEGFALHSANQPQSITEQLNFGVRTLNPDAWLVRQELIGIRPLGTCKCQFEEYPGPSTSPRLDRFDDLSLEVVAAHGDTEALFGGFLQYCTKWKSFTTILTQIRHWIEDHPQEVITLTLENKIDISNQSHLQKAFRDSGLEQYIFYVNTNNPGMDAPEGRLGGWDVSRYGYPTLRQLVNSGKRVVRSVDTPAAPGFPDQWYYEVSSVYGAKCLTPNTWTDPRSESFPLNDFTKQIFSLIHIPDLPQEINHQYDAANSIFAFRQKWNDIRDRWNRLPNMIFVDYYNKGDSVSPTSPRGPAQFVNELNAIWKSLPPIIPIAQVTPAPTASGWHNTNVQVILNGTGDRIQAITSRTFGADDSDKIPTATRVYTIAKDGTTIVTFSAVGDLGNRSPTKLVEVKIDRVPPTVTGTLDRPPDHNGWYTSNVTAHFECFDARSGVASCPEDVILTQDGAGQTVTGVAVDHAGNQGSTTITNINIDTKGPVIRAEAKPTRLWPPNGKPLLAVIAGSITDAGSGVDPATATYQVWDEYDRVEPSGRIVLGRNGKFAFLLRLEAKRSGQDRDGRKYLVYLNATDRAGHTNQTTVSIVVPHDNRRDKDLDPRDSGLNPRDNGQDRQDISPDHPNNDNKDHNNNRGGRPR